MNSPAPLGLASYTVPAVKGEEGRTPRGLGGPLLRHPRLGTSVSSRKKPDSVQGGNRGLDADRTCPWERSLPLAGRDRTLGVTPVTQPLCRDALQGRRGSFPMSSCPPSGTDLSNSQQLMLCCREVPFRLATPRPSTGTFRDHSKRSGWHLLIAEKNHQDLRCKLLQLHRVIKYSQTQTPEQKGNNRRAVPEGDSPVCTSQSGARTARGEGHRGSPDGRGGRAGYAQPASTRDLRTQSVRLPRPYFPFPKGPLHSTLPAVDSGKCPGHCLGSTTDLIPGATCQRRSLDAGPWETDRSGWAR
ncbi:uncharacterized protein LOC120619260 isoform X3 [Pteropus medius]|uniref:uncharacterized protein LOC120619260 isoform X3 n=1 Tax=Pteropus vampyrus TaxID=132908 RepID=UPI00196AA927|nr:uncharacterized protein LOC120619260 isoform X3 [Pteropus giganteus]